MLLIRRLWLVPALFFCIVFYYTFLSSPSSYYAEPNYGNIHWEKRPERYPVKELASLPTSTAAIPRIQYDFAAHPESRVDKAVRLERKQKIKEAFSHAWAGYRDYAFGKDEVMPLSGSSVNSFGGWGATTVDAMDTLWIMGMKDEFAACVTAVEHIDFTTNTERELNIFETTIRYLGGLLAAYDLSDGKYPALLEKAKELGEILYSAFDTPNRMPVCRWDWKKHASGTNLLPADFTLLAEIGSLSLEFTRLSQLTGDLRYYDAIARITNILEAAQDKDTHMPGLWPTVVDARAMTFNYNHFTFGGMADSTYEYLPKQHMLLGGGSDSYRSMYIKAMNTAEKELFFRPMTPEDADILFSGSAAMADTGASSLDPQGQHLTCFIAGMVGIGSRIFERPNDLVVARQLLDGCIWAYNSTPSGLMPETFHVVPCGRGVDTKTLDCVWDDDKYYEGVVKQDGSLIDTGKSAIEKGKQLVKNKELLPGFTAHGDSRYILRPEAIESVYILYRITGDQRYQEDAWRMWQAIDQSTRTDIANAAVLDVRKKKPVQSDRMESFWLAETLKYFYLIFEDPEVISLDDWVLNTEAHPFKRPNR
jgi:mannosyl-oligosaccharide alpha-1,2-mannosidase